MGSHVCTLVVPSHASKQKEDDIRYLALRLLPLLVAGKPFGHEQSCYGRHMHAKVAVFQGESLEPVCSASIRYLRRSITRMDKSIIHQ